MGTSPPGSTPAPPSYANRRRSQRVLLVIPVEIVWTSGQGLRVQEHAETEVVGAYGALLRMKTRLAMGSRVQIRQPRTGLSAEARVVNVSSPQQDGLVRIAIEFAVPDEAFWGIKIPPLQAPPG